MDVKQGFNAQLKAVAPQCRQIHCFIHHQALADKKLSKNLDDVLLTWVRVVNLLKIVHGTLLLHTEV